MSRRKPRSSRGRPTKLTPEVSDRIVTAVRAGNWLETAAEHAGVDRTTLYRWRQAAAEPNAPAELRAFCNMLTRARADAELRMVASVLRDAMGGVVVKEVTRERPDGTVETERQVTPPNGKVALDFLARSFPERWSPRREPVEVTGPEGGPVQVEPVGGEAVVHALADRVHALLAGGEPGEIVDAEVVDEQ